MLIVTPEQKAMMDQIHASHGARLVAVMGVDSIKSSAATAIAEIATLEEMPATYVETLAVVADIALSVRATRRRRGVKNDTRKQKQVTPL